MVLLLLVVVILLFHPVWSFACAKLSITYRDFSSDDMPPKEDIRRVRLHTR